MIAQIKKKITRIGVNKASIAFAIMTAGATALASQIILMREFFEVFYGNELSYGYLLAVWLVLTSLGSMALGAYSATGPGRGIFKFGAFQFILALIVPVSILATRAIKPFFGVMPGQIAGMWILTISASVILSPICLLTGYLFTLGCRVYPSEAPYTRSGKTFVFESAGSVLGGLAVSAIFLRFLKTLEIALIISLINAVSVFLLAGAMDGFKRYRVFFRVAAVSLVAAAAVFYGTGALYKADRVSLEKEFSGLNIYKTASSVYGHTTVIKRGDQFSFFNNGLHVATYPDKATHEETVHFPMLVSGSRKKVLLIGGGAFGTLEEILKYPVEEIDYIELDPAMISLARQALKGQSERYLDDKRVRIFNTDGRLFVKRAGAKYDVVIIDLPDPYTAQINRFYTEEFFREAFGILNEGGMLSFASTSSESYIGRDLARYLSSLYKTVKGIFPDVSIVPGARAIFLASKRAGGAAFDIGMLTERLKDLKIEAEYVRGYYLASRLSPGNIDYINSRLDSRKTTSVNSDYHPISYYYDLILWTSYFRDMFAPLLRRLRPGHIWFFSALMALFILACLARAGRRPRIMAAIGLVGLTQIAFEIILILAFQILYGYVYYKVGLILTLFMGGLSFGSFIMTERLRAIQEPMKALKWLVAAVIIYLAVSIPILAVLKDAYSAFPRALGEVIISLALPAASGIAGGAIFPLANKVYLNGALEGRAHVLSGRLYGMDLLGSAAGALLASAIVIPIIGIYQTLAVLIVLNAAILTILRR